MEPTTKKGKTRLKSKKWICSENIGKQSREYVESVLKKKKKDYSGKDLQKRKVLSLE